MSEIYGREILFKVGVESPRGTKATLGRALRKVTAKVMESATKEDDETTDGSFEDFSGSRVVKKEYSGEFDSNLHVDVFPYFLLNVYGNVESTNVAGSVYDHEFTLSHNKTHPTLTFFAKYGDIEEGAITGCVLENLEINAAENKVIKVKTSIKGRNYTSASEDYTTGTEYDFVSRDVTIKVADSELGLASAESLCIREMTITHSQGVVEKNCLGNYGLNNVFNNENKLEIKIKKDYVDRTFEDLFLSNSTKYVEIKIQGEANIGGGNNPTITYLLNKAMVKDWNKSDDKELVPEDFTLHALRNSNDGQASSVTVRNLTSSYITTPSI